MFPEIQQPLTSSTILICTYKVNLPRPYDFPVWLIKTNKDQRSPYECDNFYIQKDAKGWNDNEACND